MQTLASYYHKRFALQFQAFEANITTLRRIVIDGRDIKRQPYKEDW